MKPELRPRPGAALLIALLVLLVLDCVVLSTLHLALLERRLADNATMALRLRLAAESGARESLGAWTAEVDTLSLEDAPARLLTSMTADGLRVVVDVRRAGPDGFMLTALASEPAPAVGRATAVLLVRPPALSPTLLPSAAALAAGGSVDVGDGASILTRSGDACTAGGALIVASPDRVDVADGADVQGGTSIVTASTDVAGTRHRIFALADSVIDGDYRVEQDVAGTLIVRGNLTLAAGTRVSGLVIVGGDLIVEAGAVLSGAAHAGAGARVDGMITLDACAAERAIQAAGLREPRPFHSRAWLPGF